MEESNEQAAETSDYQDVEFPLDALGKLDEMISRPRWVVPVLPKGELEVLLNAALNLARKGIDRCFHECSICICIYVK